jgi:hypothetical protein
MRRRLVRAVDAFGPTTILCRAQWRRPYRAGSRWYFSTPVQSCRRSCGRPSRRNQTPERRYRRPVRRPPALRQRHHRRRLPHSSSLLQRLDRNLDWKFAVPPWGSRTGALADKVPAGDSLPPYGKSSKGVTLQEICRIGLPNIGARPYSAPCRIEGGSSRGSKPRRSETRSSVGLESLPVARDQLHQVGLAFGGGLLVDAV